MQFLRIYSGVFLTMFAISCAPSYSKYISKYEYKGGNEAPDYSNPYYWAAHPAKHDPSDSIPAPLQKDFQPDSSADVFFLYPTSLTDPADTRWNAGINDAVLNAKTDYSSILYQASVFNEYPVFAPRYRQAHLRSYVTEDTAAALAAFELAYQDIRTAFKYYLDKHNNGRPIIIAAHSQGTTHAMRLLKEFFDTTDLSKKLVAAYITGMYIPENYFAALQLCKEARQTNCFCGWRTYQSDYSPEFTQKEKTKSIVVNPLSWTNNNDLVPATFNQGAVLRKFNKVYYNVSDARINGGILWTHKPKFPGSFLLRTKNYHIGDINLYYHSIRLNVRERVGAYKKSGPHAANQP